MSKKKGTELKLHQREHFERKIEKRLKPEIEREELRIKTTIQSILNKGQKNFAKKIGADKVISALEKAEENLRTASRNAYIFFDKEASKSVPYSKSKKHAFNRDEKDDISVKDCREQLTTILEQGVWGQVSRNSGRSDREQSVCSILSWPNLSPDLGLACFKE